MSACRQWSAEAAGRVGGRNRHDIGSGGVCSTCDSPDFHYREGRLRLQRRQREHPGQCLPVSGWLVEGPAAIHVVERELAWWYAYLLRAGEPDRVGFFWSDHELDRSQPGRPVLRDRRN